MPVMEELTAFDKDLKLLESTLKCAPSSNTVADVSYILLRRTQDANIRSAICRESGFIVRISALVECKQLQVVMNAVSMAIVLCTCNSSSFVSHFLEGAIKLDMDMKRRVTVPSNVAQSELSTVHLVDPIDRDMIISSSLVSKIQQTVSKGFAIHCEDLITALKSNPNLPFHRKRQVRPQLDVLVHVLVKELKFFTVSTYLDVPCTLRTVAHVWPLVHGLLSTMIELKLEVILPRLLWSALELGMECLSTLLLRTAVSDDVLVEEAEQAIAVLTCDLGSLVSQSEHVESDGKCHSLLHVVVHYFKLTTIFSHQTLFTTHTLRQRSVASAKAHALLASCDYLREMLLFAIAMQASELQTRVVENHVLRTFGPVKESNMVTWALRFQDKTPVQLDVEMILADYMLQHENVLELLSLLDFPYQWSNELIPPIHLFCLRNLQTYLHLKGEDSLRSRQNVNAILSTLAMHIGRFDDRNHNDDNLNVFPISAMLHLLIGYYSEPVHILNFKEVFDMSNTVSLEEDGKEERPTSPLLVHLGVHLLQGVANAARDPDDPLQQLIQSNLSTILSQCTEIVDKFGSKALELVRLQQVFQRMVNATRLFHRGLVSPTKRSSAGRTRRVNFVMSPSETRDDIQLVKRTPTKPSHGRRPETSHRSIRTYRKRTINI